MVQHNCRQTLRRTLAGNAPGNLWRDRFAVADNPLGKVALCGDRLFTVGRDRAAPGLGIRKPVAFAHRDAAEEQPNIWSHVPVGDRWNNLAGVPVHAGSVFGALGCTA